MASSVRQHSSWSLLFCWFVGTFLHFSCSNTHTHTALITHTWVGRWLDHWWNTSLTQFGCVSMIFFYTCLSSSNKPQRPTQRHVKEANGCVRASRTRIPKKKPCLIRPIRPISLQFSHLCHFKKIYIQLQCIITTSVLIFCSLVGKSHRIQLQVISFVSQYDDACENRY